MDASVSYGLLLLSTTIAIKESLGLASIFLNIIKLIFEEKKLQKAREGFTEMRSLLTKKIIQCCS